MVGGSGQIFDMGEKACIDLLGKPLIGYVIDALKAASKIDDIFVAISDKAPDTMNLLDENYLDIVEIVPTSGMDYVGDMIEAVRKAKIEGPVLIIMYDLVMVTSELLDSIVDEYEKCAKPAMSVYVPISAYRSVGARPDTVFNKDGRLIVPTGINIMKGKDIHIEQEDCNLILDIPELAMGIKTLNDIDKCKKMLQRREIRNIH